MGYQNNCPVGYAARHGVSKQLSSGVHSKTWGIKTIVLQGKPQDMDKQFGVKGYNRRLFIIGHPTTSYNNYALYLAQVTEENIHKKI